MDNAGNPVITVGHTVVYTDAEGRDHVQKLGREHVVEGSETGVTLGPGDRIIIRHVNQ